VPDENRERGEGMTGRIISGTLSFFLLLLLLLSLSCLKKDAAQVADNTIKVVTTLFPVYDFAKNVGGNLVQVELLVPPGIEPHSFEPKPGDIRKISDADIFIYTGKFMEPWIEDVLKGISSKNLVVVDTGTGVVLSGDQDSVKPHAHNEPPDGYHGHHPGYLGKDPHVWLDFSNAQTMVENILNGFVAKDPANRQIYMKNAEAYVSQLSVLDRQFRDELSSCRKRVIIHGGHFAFGYLARRYNLRYLSAYSGFSPNAEPAPRDIIQLIENLRTHRLNYIFFEELLSPNVAGTISRETGAQLLMLHGAHNISKNELEGKVTFLSLMENNLKNLKIGLDCQ
jgi:zinc transport system substrate-binding protein